MALAPSSPRIFSQSDRSATIDRAAFAPPSLLTTAAIRSEELAIVSLLNPLLIARKAASGFSSAFAIACINSFFVGMEHIENVSLMARTSIRFLVLEAHATRIILWRQQPANGKLQKLDSTFANPTHETVGVCILSYRGFSREPVGQFESYLDPPNHLLGQERPESVHASSEFIFCEVAGNANAIDCQGIQRSRVVLA